MPSWVSGSGELTPYRRLIVELAEKSRLPVMYTDRDFMDAGGLMAYAVDFGELGRRMADDVHQILNGAKPSDIPGEWLAAVLAVHGPRQARRRSPRQSVLAPDGSFRH